MPARIPPALLAGLIGLLPPAALAQSSDRNPPHQTPAQREAEAFAACGGGPIKGSRDVQPNPQRDACLAKMRGMKPPTDLAPPGGQTSAVPNEPAQSPRK